MSFMSYGATALLLILSLNVQAQNKDPKRTRVPGTTTSVPTNQSTARIENTNPQLEWIKQRLTVGGFISTADSLTSDSLAIRSTATATAPVSRGSVDFGSSSVLGVQAQVIEMRTPNWGWFANASVEQGRELSNALVKVGGGTANASFSNKPRFTPWIVSGGGVYRFNEKFYALAGVNYTVYKDLGGGDFRNASLDSKFGLQYGVGLEPIERVSLELVQREVNYDFSGNIGDARVSADSLKMAGFNLIARYSFQ